MPRLHTRSTASLPRPGPRSAASPSTAAAGRAPCKTPAILAIAGTHGKAAAQVILRWHLQRGRSVIPKPVTPERIAENFDMFGFDLTADELDALDALDTGVRGGPGPASITLENFGMPIPEA